LLLINNLVYGSPFIVISALSKLVSSGASSITATSGGIVSITVTTLVVLASFPLLSATL